MLIQDEDISSIIFMTTELLRSEYNYTHEVTDSMIDLISTLARLIETVHIRYDYEFKELCWEWEMNHE